MFDTLCLMSPPTMRELHISLCDDVKGFPDHFTRLSGLEVIEISSLTSAHFCAPLEMSCFSKLVTFSVRLRRAIIQSSRWSDTFRSIRNLSSLRLVCRQVTGKMAFQFPKSLITLYLQISAGTTLASRFSELKTLPHFRNLIVGDCHRTLLNGMPDLVASIVKLQHLTLVGCKRVPPEHLKRSCCPKLSFGFLCINKHSIDAPNLQELEIFICHSTSEDLSRSVAKLPKMARIKSIEMDERSQRTCPILYSWLKSHSKQAPISASIKNKYEKWRSLIPQRD